MKEYLPYIMDLTQADGGRFGIQSLDDAYSFCEKIAKSHYENFPVGSLLIPKKIRKHFYAIYAFSRVADDLGDELTAKGASFQLKALNKFEDLLVNSNVSTNCNPIFVALHNTMLEKNIPIAPLSKLLKAFRMDVEFSQPATMHDIENYCQYSANPVGELVLRLFDEYNNRNSILSDKICTGLQLANFWQDISRDIRISRYYYPQQLLDKYNISKDNLLLNKNSINLHSFLTELYNLTESYFLEGRELIELLANWRLRLEIKTIVGGGELILKKLKSLGTNVLATRPTLSKTDIFKIFFGSKA